VKSEIKLDHFDIYMVPTNNVHYYVSRFRI